MSGLRSANIINNQPTSHKNMIIGNNNNNKKGGYLNPQQRGDVTRKTLFFNYIIQRALNVRMQMNSRESTLTLNSFLGTRSCIIIFSASSLLHSVNFELDSEEKYARATFSFRSEIRLGSKIALSKKAPPKTDNVFSTFAFLRFLIMSCLIPLYACHHFGVVFLGSVLNGRKRSIKTGLYKKAPSPFTATPFLDS